MSLGEWKEITDGTFQVDGKVVKFGEAIPLEGAGVTSISAQRNVRVQRIEQPLVDGAKHKIFGNEVVPHTAEIIFFGENYYQRYLDFRELMLGKKAGILTLPQLDESVNAVPISIGEASEFASAHTISVNAVWEETILTDPSNIVQDDRTKDKDEEDSRTLLQKATANAGEVMRDNAFLNGVKSFEAGLSTVRQYVNAALTLEAGVRNRIIGIQANIEGTLSLLGVLVERIAGERGRQSTATSTSGTVLGLDPITGLQIGDVSQDDEVITNVDPLEEPEPEADIGIDTRSVTTEASQDLVLSKVAEQLTADRDQLNTDGAGQVLDVTVAITEVINLITDYKAAILTPELRQILTPMEVSFMEIIHITGGDVVDMRAFHKKNTGLEDLLVIPRGTVVNL